QLVDYLRQGIREEVFPQEVRQAGSLAARDLTASLDGLDRLGQNTAEGLPAASLPAPVDYVAAAAESFIRETMERTGLSEQDARKAVYLGLSGENQPARPAPVSAGSAEEEIMRAIARAEE